MLNEHKTKLNSAWGGMHRRCYSKVYPYYHRYGGRGIRCLWKSKNDFINDMGDLMIQHIKEHGILNTTLDRINNDGHYCKENCRWTTKKQQVLNRGKKMYFNGKTKTEVSVMLGGNRNLVHDREKKGWKIDKIITTPVNKPQTYDCNGKQMTIREMSETFNIKRTTLEKRLWELKLPASVAVSKPVLNKYKYKGQSHSLYKWAKILDIKYQKLHRLVNNGVSFKKAVNHYF